MQPEPKKDASSRLAESWPQSCQCTPLACHPALMISLQYALTRYTPSRMRQKVWVEDKGAHSRFGMLAALALWKQDDYDRWRGMIITDDAEIAKRVTLMTAKQAHPYEFYMTIGHNYRPPNINAALVPN